MSATAPENSAPTTPKAETPKAEAPKAEAPKAEAPTPTTPTSATPKKEDTEKPATTVFVGGIKERAPNSLMKELLGVCGVVNSWRRVAGTDGKLQSFGFCEFADPEDSMTCVRLMNQLPVGGKALIVRVDATTQEKLDKYKVDRGLSDKPDEAKDAATKQKLQQVIQKFAAELERVEDGEIDSKPPQPPPRLVGPKETLDDMDLDNDKRSIINREIEFFRSRYREESPKSDRLERERERERERRRREKREKEREKDKERERDKEDQRRKERTAEADEEQADRRRQEQRLLDKEESYQSELRHWSQRERRKARDAERQEEREAKRRSEEAKEARRLRDFLAEYDDENDDQKFYRSSGLQRRLREREKEKELDARDRQQEKEEIEEARRRLLADGRLPEDVEAICAELEAARDAHTRRLLPVEELPVANGRATTTTTMTTTTTTTTTKPPDGDADGARDDRDAGVDQGDNDVAGDVGGDDSGDDNNDVDEAEEPQEESSEQPEAPATQQEAPDQQPRRRRHDQPEAFADEEEKKSLIKRLIDRIPTSREQLFKYELDWPIVDQQLMENRVKPWVNKKIIEYIGEEERQLTEFVCLKVMERTHPDTILKEIAMVLDEEAEVFVVKLWRLLIYETEAKKAGLVA